MTTEGKATMADENKRTRSAGPKSRRHLHGLLVDRGDWKEEPTMTNDSGAETVAQWFHEAYERLAPDFGYETRKDSAVPWADVPEPNRSLMIAVAAAVLQKVDIALNLPVGVALADTRP